MVRRRLSSGEILPVRNTSIEQALVNARRLDIKALVEACQYELRARGSLNLPTAEAERTSTISAKVAGKALSEVIELAFNDVPAKPEEVLILRWISEHPGASHAEIGVVYGRRDLSLVIGHLIYYRFGYFRTMLFSPIQSDLLLERDDFRQDVLHAPARISRSLQILGYFGRMCSRREGPMMARPSVGSRSRSFWRRVKVARQVRTHFPRFGLAILSIFVGLALAFQLRTTTPWRGVAEPFAFNSRSTQLLGSSADGLQNIPRDSPYYAPWLDRDNDGLACEPWHGPPCRVH